MKKLSAVAVRIVGCLIEKELATPDYYPLTLNALVNACNQKSNREPVMTLSEEQVLEGLEELRREQLIYRSAEGVRSARYCHHLAARYHLEQEELAVLAVLLLRGPQTIGEIRGRTERMYDFADLDQVEAVIKGMSDADPALVVRLPRLAGRKEHRFADLLRDAAGPDIAEEDPGSAIAPSVPHDGRLAALEQEVAALREELGTLTERFERFRTQFE
ncbi:MAG: YceH family protein [Pelovirga sp.]